MQRLGPRDARNLTPSVRDFHQAVVTQRRALSVTLDPGDDASLIEQADGLGVSALALAPDGGVPAGGSGAGGTNASTDTPRALDDLALPVIGREAVGTRDSLYASRLAGADAAVFRAGGTSVQELRALVEIASSMHMAPVIEVGTEVELAQASAVGARIVVVSLERAGALLARVPRLMAAIVRGSFADPADLAPWRGKADGVWLTGPLPSAEDPRAFLERFVEAAENG